MTLTVRLDDTLAAALAAHCAAHGTTKSRVVQESLAAYLLDRQADASEAAGAAKARTENLSKNYRAFADAGLIGGVALGRGSDKAAVRARVAESFAERKARRGGV